MFLQEEVMSRQHKKRRMKGLKAPMVYIEEGGEEGKEEVNEEVEVEVVNEEEEEMHTLSTNIVELYISALIGL